MPGSANGVPFQGAIYIRATDNSADYDTFLGGITDAEYETAFPVATTKYSDAAGGVEIPSTPEGEYENAQGGYVSPFSLNTINIPLTGLTETEEIALYLLQNTDVDLAVKNSVCGENGLGGGEVFRTYNLYIGKTRMIGGIKTYPLQLKRKYPACSELKVNQTFNIVSA